MEKRNIFTVLNDKGEEVQCEVLFTFQSEETNRNYIVYTDNSVDEDGNFKVYANIFDPSGEISELLPITTDREWEIIEIILEEIKKEVEKNNKSGNNSL